MKTTHQAPLPFAVLVLSMLVWLTPALGRAQSGAGTIEGRVMKPATGEYLEGARLTVEGTSLEAFTDSEGRYRLSNVPAGPARVRVFFTGSVTQTDTVAVSPGATAQHDIQLARASADAGAGGTIKLSEFVVEASREMDGAALAINEQRFASKIKNVVSTEEFGNVAEGNVAEFLKFLPGVSISYTGGNAREVSINGVPSDNVPVTIDGFSLASADAGTRRYTQVDMVSLNNLSRIEVSYSPTPESQGAALAGSVNMVPRSSFERSKPLFNYSAYIMMRDNAREFHRVHGPQKKATRNVHPGFDFSWVRPVNKKFGFTLSAGYSTQYSAQDLARSTWRGAGFPTNGAAYPHTTPDRPYLSSYAVQDEPKVTTRRSIGLSLDYKLSRNDRIAFGFQYSSFDVLFMANLTQFEVGRVLPGDFSPTLTRGAAGAGFIQMNHVERNRFNDTFMPTLVWRHDGSTWKADAGIGHSQQSNYDGDRERGLFRTTTARRTGVTVAFDDNFYLRPRVITVTDSATGVPVDPFSLDSYALTVATTAGGNVYDLKRTAYANLRRDYYGRIPFSLKAGLDLRYSLRDLRGWSAPYSFVGRDGRPTTTPAAGDDSALPFLDEGFSQRVSPYGFPKIQTVSNNEIHAFYRDNPGQFVLNDNTAYRSEVTQSKRAGELVSSAYLRGDVYFFERRLKLVGGVRAEQTNIKAQGSLLDPTRNFQRDARGAPVIGANGRPLSITSDPFEVSKLTYLDRGSRTDKEFLRLFPNINASFNVRDNLIARASYYHSIGRPNFNQYAGGITLPDTETPPGPGNRIVVNNAGIKAWTAKTVNLRLEYYFEGVGQFSVGAFRRDFTNFFAPVVINAPSGFLAIYGLDAATYGDYDVATQRNLPGVVRMSGVDFNYKQALTFLPRWARGIQVFANASAQRATGESSDNFAGYVPRSGSWGVSFTRERYNLRANWNYRGRQRRGPVASGPSIEPGTYNWGSKRLYIDVLGEYFFRKNMAVFMNLRNVTNATEDIEMAGPSTPDLAQFRQRIDYGSLWTFGIKGTF